MASEVSASTPPASTTNSLTEKALHVTDSMSNGLSSAKSMIQDNEIAQRISNDPITLSVKAQANQTSSEFSNLAASRATPDTSTATGQPLTHYHSLFYNLLSWKNPRATGITFACSILIVLLARYLNIISHVLKFVYFTLGITTTLEIAGKTFFNNGLATSMRPRKYFTISKESLEIWLQDLEQLINFFVIEAQRILFAENVAVTVAAFASAFVSYWLFKIVPLWGLVLIGTCVVFLTPLVYITNRDTIDSLLDTTSQVVSDHASHLREMTAHHSAGATESLRGIKNQYTAKAHEYMTSRRYFDQKPQHITTPPLSSTLQDLPTAPKAEPDVKNEANYGSFAPGNTTGGEAQGTDPQAIDRNFRDTADGGEKVISTADPVTA